MSQIPRPSLLILAASFALPMAAGAVVLVVNNPSFESPASPVATFTGGQTFGPTGWTVYNTGATDSDRFFGVWNPATTDSFTNPVPDGVNIGVVSLNNTTGLAEAGLRQVLGDTLQLSMRHTLTVEVGISTRARAARRGTSRGSPAIAWTCSRGAR